jgi:Na+/proline symporter
MHALDLATIAVYLIAITWFGAHFRKSQRDLKDYFRPQRTLVGDRAVHRLG